MAWADALRRGFARHGLTALITPERGLVADVHVVLGPWYAKTPWLGHPRTILLDRCYYRGDPEHGSLGWMRADGGRDWLEGDGSRQAPEIGWTNGVGTIYLKDHQPPPTDAPIIARAATVRVHPTRAREPQTPLLADLARHSHAVGYRTSALVTAALAGLSVEALWPPHILHWPNWLELLPYADWSHEEIAAGAAWEHLRAGLKAREAA